MFFSLSKMILLLTISSELGSQICRFDHLKRKTNCSNRSTDIVTTNFLCRSPDTCKVNRPCVHSVVECWHPSFLGQIIPRDWTQQSHNSAGLASSSWIPDGLLFPSSLVLTSWRIIILEDHWVGSKWLRLTPSRSGLCSALPKSKSFSPGRDSALLFCDVARSFRETGRAFLHRSVNGRPAKQSRQ